MGWFFNRNNNSSDQNTPYDPNNQNQSHFSVKKSFSSTKRTCQNDPEDNQFMICKTVIKDDNGTREEQERIPINNGFSNREGFPRYESSSPFRNPATDGEKAFQGFPSFFIQPSFFDFHNSAQQANPENQNGFHSFSRNYSQSSSCKPDPQDNEYLICKSKIKDESGTREIEQRVKASNKFGISPFATQLGNFGHEIDKQMHEFMNQMNHGMNFVMPFIGSMMNFVNDLQNLDKNMNIPHGKQNQNYFPRNTQYNQQQQRPDENDSRYFSTSQSKKDTNIYDL